MAKERLFNATGQLKCDKCRKLVASDKLKKHRCKKETEGKPRTKVFLDVPPPGAYRTKEKKEMAERAWLKGACLKCGRYGHDVVDCKKLTSSE